SPNGPWAGIDIEPNYFQTPLRGIHVNGVIGKGNKGPLTQIALNMADTNIPPEGGRYDCQITIDGVSDDSSRGAFEFWGGLTEILFLTDTFQLRTCAPRER
ncbi:hypothetical protein, partial [Escherichia coli]